MSCFFAFCYGQSKETLPEEDLNSVAFTRTVLVVRENFLHRSEDLMREFPDDAFFQRRELPPEQKSDLDNVNYAGYLNYSKKQFDLYMKGALASDSFFSNIGAWIAQHRIQRLIIPPNREQAENFLRKAQVVHQQYQSELRKVASKYPRKYAHFLEQQEEGRGVYEKVHFSFPNSENRDQIPYSNKENETKHSYIDTMVFRRLGSENIIRPVLSWEAKLNESNTVEVLTPALFKAFQDKDLFLLPGGHMRISQIHSINIVPKSLWATAPFPMDAKASLVKKFMRGNEVFYKFYLPEGLSTEEVAVHMQELQRKIIGNTSSDVVTFNPLLEAYGKTEKLLGAGVGVREECFPPPVIYDF